MFQIHHWDTFDNETVLLEEFETLGPAIKWAEERYGDRISEQGADKVDIVDTSNGYIVWQRSVT